MLLIYVPCKNQEEAKKIGRVLVKEKLACCINILPNIHSIFPWGGKVEETSESLLLLKTLSPYKKVRSRIEQLHSYSIPLISCIKLSNVNQKYKKWAKKEQNRKK